MLKSGDNIIARRSTLLAGLPKGVAEELLRQSAVRHYDRGTTVFLQGEPAASAFIVLEGWVKLIRFASNGAEAIVGCFTAGQSFGEAVVLQEVPFPVTAEAVTDCRLAHVQARVLFEMMDRRPEVARAILASMYVHLHALVSQIEQLKARTGAQRVAEFLLELCHDAEGSCSVRLPYDKVLIAGRLGMKPESLSRTFARLRKVGVDIQHNTADIADVERLRAYVREDPASAWNKVHA